MWEQVHCPNFLFSVNSSHVLLGCPVPLVTGFLRGSRGGGSHGQAGQTFWHQACLYWTPGRHTGCVKLASGHRPRMHAKLLQWYPTLCKPMECSLPSSFAHGILQARILEWVAMLSSRGSSRPRDQTCISCVSCISRQVLYH